jgi:hypothetical protein
MISAIYTFALTTGANRVVRGARIEHVCGDPSLGPEKDYAFGLRIVEAALGAIATPVAGPTLFDPLAAPAEVGSQAAAGAAAAGGAGSPPAREAARAS